MNKIGWCEGHGVVEIDYGDDGHIADDGDASDVVLGHDPSCMGDCHRYGCPIPVQVQADPRYPCGPVRPLTNELVAEALRLYDTQQIVGDTK